LLESIVSSETVLLSFGASSELVMAFSDVAHFANPDSDGGGTEGIASPTDMSPSFRFDDL
jgi:hypothetical protein